MPKIHQLPPLTDDPADADVLPMDDASVSDPSSPNKTKQIELSQLRDWILAEVAVGNNLLINGNFDIWQRNTTFTPNDDTYIADRWNCLQEANSSWTFARDTTVPAEGSAYALKLTNSTANNQCGIVQILETKDAQALAGKTVSLSFQARTTGLEISNLRVALLSWTGTADSVTSDVISAWGQNGTNPTWATNWTMENTPSNLALTNAYQLFTVEGIVIDTASMNNIAVVIWVDDGTIASGDDFWISQVMLNVGGTAADFTPRPYGQELALCQRYFEKSFKSTTVPATGTEIVFRNGCSPTGSGGIDHDIYFKVNKRTSPAFTFYGNSTSSWEFFDGSWTACTTTGTNISETSAQVHLARASGSGFNDAKTWLTRGNWVADAEL